MTEGTGVRYPWRGVGVPRLKMGERRERGRLIVGPCELDPRSDPDRVAKAINGHTHNTTAPRFQFTNTIILKQAFNGKLS